MIPNSRPGNSAMEQRRAYAVVFSIPLLILVSASWHYEFGIIVGLLCCPPPLALFWWHRQLPAGSCSLAHVIVSYGQGFWLLGSCATLVGFGAFYAGQILALMVTEVFFSWFSPIYQLAAVLSASLVAFIAAEEGVKLVFAKWQIQAVLRARQATTATAAAGETVSAALGSHARQFVIGTASASLGHASALSVILTLLVMQSFLAEDDKISGVEFSYLAFWAFVFAVASMPINVLTSYYLALQLQKLPKEVLLGNGNAFSPYSHPRSTPHGQPPHGPSFRATVWMPPASAGAPGSSAGPAGGPGAPAAGAKPSSMWHLLAWPVKIRAAFAAQPLLWFTLLGRLGNWSIYLTVSCILLTACVLYRAVHLKVRAVEGTLPTATSTRRRFGFALLADDDPDDSPGGEGGGGIDGEGRIGDTRRGNSNEPPAAFAAHASRDDDPTRRPPPLVAVATLAPSPGQPPASFSRAAELEDELYPPSYSTLGLEIVQIDPAPLPVAVGVAVAVPATAGQGGALFAASSPVAQAVALPAASPAAAAFVEPAQTGAREDGTPGFARAAADDAAATPWPAGNAEEAPPALPAQQALDAGAAPHQDGGIGKMGK
mmetsp:Transcript_3096/g.7603  ORF Transcript_3096/g.7603 Transcript_3096/m.7603 type:complete len:601 (+) Transcript_3096:3-1805(+)